MVEVSFNVVTQALQSDKWQGTAAGQHVRPGLPARPVGRVSAQDMISQGRYDCFEPEPVKRCRGLELATQLPADAIQQRVALFSPKRPQCCLLRLATKVALGRSG